MRTLGTLDPLTKLLVIAFTVEIWWCYERMGGLTNSFGYVLEVLMHLKVAIECVVLSFRTRCYSFYNLITILLRIR